MSNSMFLTTFNKQMEEMLEDVMRIFHDDKKIIKAKLYFEGLMKTNPRIVIQVWKTHITSKYHDKISQGDVDFFIHNDFTEDVNSSGGNVDTVTNTIHEIRKIISRMNDEQMKVMMVYIQNLTKLSSLYL